MDTNNLLKVIAKLKQGNDKNYTINVVNDALFVIDNNAEDKDKELVAVILPRQHNSK
jgi:hypothetical protein